MKPPLQCIAWKTIKPTRPSSYDDFHAIQTRRVILNFLIMSVQRFVRRFDLIGMGSATQQPELSPETIRWKSVCLNIRSRTGSEQSLTNIWWLTEGRRNLSKVRKFIVPNQEVAEQHIRIHRRASPLEEDIPNEKLAAHQLPAYHERSLQPSFHTLLSTKTSHRNQSEPFAGYHWNRERYKEAFPRNHHCRLTEYDVVSPFPRGDKKKLLELSILNVKQYKADQLKQTEKLNPEQRTVRLLKEIQELHLDRAAHAHRMFW